MEEEKNNQNQNDSDNYWEQPFNDVPLGGDLNKEKESEPTPKKDQDEQKLRKVDIKRYKDIGGLTLKKLNIGLWYIEHKKQMRSLLVGLLILISAISWVYTIYGFAYYIARGMDEDNLLANQIVNSGFINREAILSAAPQELLYHQIGTLKSTSGYDFFIKIDNVNKRHAAEFTYYFTIGDEETERHQGFILPEESKYLLSLSNDLGVNPLNALLNFDNFRWKRIDRHEISDWGKYKKEHFDVIINEANFTPSSQNKLSDKLNINSLEFTASNETIFNYWSVDFVILLYSGFNIIGVNKYTLEEFMSEQESFVSISWPGRIGRVSKVEVLPELNILKDDIYIKYEGGVGEEK